MATETNETDSSEPVTLERFEELLDTHGATLGSWPEAAREPARRLLDGSAAARALWRETAGFDRMLRALPAEPASRAVAERVLAGIPRRRARAWRTALGVVVPLAAAAAVAVWIGVGREGSSTPNRQAAGAPAAVMIGEYSAPTDVLLDSYGVDVYANVPAIGCSDSILGCTDMEPTGGRTSERSSSGRLRA